MEGRGEAAQEVTAEMLALAEKAYRARVVCRKTFDEWLSEMPANEAPEVRRAQAAHLGTLARMADTKASDAFRRVCRVPELRKEIMDMLERENS